MQFAGESLFGHPQDGFSIHHALPFTLFHWEQTVELGRLTLCHWCWFLDISMSPVKAARPSAPNSLSAVPGNNAWSRFTSPKKCVEEKAVAKSIYDNESPELRRFTLKDTNIKNTPMGKDYKLRN